jgi:hypothetical protein
VLSGSLQEPSGAPHPDAVEAALVGSLAFPWTVHGLVVWLSAVGLRPLASRGFSVAILLFAVSVVTFFVVRLAGRSARAAQAPSAALPRAGRGVALLLSVGALAVLGGSLLTALALPVIAYDALSYRLPVIAEWLDSGRIAWIATDDAVRNGYPLGQEAVSSVIVAATGSMRFVAAPSFFYVAAGALSIWHFAVRAGVRTALARAAAALFLLVPMVVLNAPSAYVDASFAGAAVAFLLLSAELVGAGPGGFVVAAAAGMAAAHALALKGTGLAVVLSTGLVAAPALLMRRRQTDGAARRDAVRTALVAVAFAAPGAFWVLRNVVHTGNPLWPVELRVAGYTLFPGLASMDAVLDVAHNTPPALARLSEPLRVLRTWTEWAGPAMDFDDRTGGLGLIWPMFAVPAVVLTGVRLVRSDAALARRTSIAVALGSTALAFAIQPMRWWPRYTIWVWGIGAVAMALSAEWLLREGRSRLLTLALAAVTAVAFIEGGIALFHANGLATAIGRARSVGISSDPRHAVNATAWVDRAFWDLEVARASNVCRGAWKPGTDDANLDGVLAQLSPRPTVHVLDDDGADWAAVQKASKEAGCADLLLLRGSPVLPLAEQDPEVTVERAVAFDPLYVVRPRRLARLDTRNVTQ